MASKSSTDREIVRVDNRVFEIVKKIGRGSTCEVYLGLDQLTQKKVAVKVYKTQGTFTSRTVQREIQGLRDCRGPGLCRIVGYDLESEFCGRKKTIVVNDYYPHGELYDLLEKGKVDQECAIPMMKQILRGVQIMHNNGYAHRDIKPENILIDKDFNLVIADFGYAKKADERMKTNCGTEGYTAPEVRLKMSNYTTKCDVFSCGVILFIMISGFPPFQKTTQRDWWFNKLSQDPDLFWRAHERVHTFTDMQKEILMLMLQPSSQKRPTVSEILEHPYFSQISLTKDEVKAEIQSRLVYE